MTEEFTEFTDQDVAMTLVALRFLQEAMVANEKGEGPDPLEQYRDMGYFDSSDPHTVQGVEDLCERVNYE